MNQEPDLDTVVDGSCRMNPQSGFSDLVCDYLWHEWGVEILLFPKEKRIDIIRNIDKMSVFGVCGASTKVMEWLWSNGFKRWKQEELF